MTWLTKQTNKKEKEKEKGETLVLSIICKTIVILLPLCGPMSNKYGNSMDPRVHNSHIIRRGHRIKTGLEDCFCKNYIKL